MKLTARLTNLGIELSLHEGDGPKPLKPAEDANQKNPRRSYVYAHMDSAGNIFYVGKGEARRAWSAHRHPLWRRYVEKHLGGKYRIRILQDNLSPRKAEELEAAWMAQCADGLVNLINMGRRDDYQASERYHKLRNTNRALIQHAKAVEKRDLSRAAQMYVQAIEAIRGYAFIHCQKGIVGQLFREEADEFGMSGEVEALDRLTMCLIKLGRAVEADQRAKEYFTLYRLDLMRATSRRITKRIEKALARTYKRREGEKAKRKPTPMG